MKKTKKQTVERKLTEKIILLLVKCNRSTSKTHVLKKKLSFAERAATDVCVGVIVLDVGGNFTAYVSVCVKNIIVLASFYFIKKNNTFTDIDCHYDVQVLLCLEEIHLFKEVHN